MHTIHEFKSKGLIINLFYPFIIKEHLLQVLIKYYVYIRTCSKTPGQKTPLLFQFFCLATAPLVLNAYTQSTACG